MTEPEVRPPIPSFMDRIIDEGGEKTPQEKFEKWKGESSMGGELEFESYDDNMLVLSSSLTEVRILIPEEGGAYTVWTDEEEVNEIIGGFLEEEGNPPFDLLLDMIAGRIRAKIDEEEEPDDDYQLDIAIDESLKPEPPTKSEDDIEITRHIRDGKTPVSVKRLFNAFKTTQEMEKYGIRASLKKEDDLYAWNIEFFDFPKDAPLWKDMRDKGIDSIHLEALFTSEYPFMAPFIRVVRPRFKRGTGHITEAGAICLESLTTTGWTSASSLENILVEIRSLMVAGEARLNMTNLQPYDEAEARRSFLAVARGHGWEK